MHRQSVQPRGDFARIRKRRRLPHRRQGNFLQHFIDRLRLTQARKGDRSQPAIVLGERCLPVDGGLVHRVAWWPAACACLSFPLVIMLPEGGWFLQRDPGGRDFAHLAEVP